MDPDRLVHEWPDRRVRQAELLYLAGLLIMAWVVAPWVLVGLYNVRDVVELCGTDPVLRQDAAAPCPVPRLVVGVVRTVVAVLPLAVFAIAARRPRRVGEPWAVLARLLACWLGCYLLQLLWLMVGLALLKAP
jgi:hypothetical protein